jgi:hypothetical protein
MGNGTFFSMIWEIKQRQMPDTNNNDSNTPNSESWNRPQNAAADAKDSAKKTPVDQALVKEKQPTSPEDLSAVHNTHEIGTSGGDQRAPDVEPEKKEEEESEQPGKPVRPIPVEEPGEGAAPEVEYDDPKNEPPMEATQ